MSAHVTATPEHAELAALRELQAGVTEALRNCVNRAGDLIDPVTNRRTPDDHYALTFTALALACQDPQTSHCQALVARYGAIPSHRKGHAPFNRLALLLLQRLLPAQLDGPHQRLISRALGDTHCQPLYRSNNWAFLAGLGDLLDAPKDEAGEAAGRLSRMAAQWTTAQGGFIDYPPNPGRAICTPLAYHAKFLFCLDLASRIHPSDEWADPYRRALRWLLAFCDKTGACGGFGRSTHALFGSAAQLAVYAEQLRQAADPMSRMRWTEHCQRLRRLLEQNRRADGLLGLNLNAKAGAAGGWDTYMYLTVYNAWAAGLLGWVLARPALGPASGAHPDDGPPVGAWRDAGLHDPQAGLLAVHSTWGTAGITTHGQPAQLGIRQALDLRYQGLMPFNVVWRGKRVTGPPVLTRAGDFLTQPAQAGWVPLFRRRQALFSAGQPAALTLVRDGARVLVLREGYPSLAHSGPEGGTRLGRMARRVGRRLRPRHPVRLHDHALVHGLWLDLEAGRLTGFLLLRGRPSSPVMLLNPFGHAEIPDSGQPRARGLQFWDASGCAPVRFTQLAGCELPSATGGCNGYAGAPVPWPNRDSVWITDLALGEHDDITDSPLRWVANRNVLETPVGTVPLPDPPTGRQRLTLLR